jgi:hypothetical protein
MLIKFSAIIEESAALKAVESNGDALRYVSDFDLFVKIATKLNISWSK